MKIKNSLFYGGSDPNKTITLEDKTAGRSQIRQSAWDGAAMSQFNTNNPVKHDMSYYNTLRANFPFLDVIPAKKIRLMGVPYISIPKDEKTEEEINIWLKYMRVNNYSHGLDSYIYQTEDNAFALGFDVSEILPFADASGIWGMITTNPQTFAFVQDKNNGAVLCQKHYGQIQPTPIKNMEYINYLAHDQRMGKPHGHSIFYSIPFVSQILWRMYKSVDNTFWRIGDPSFLVVAEGGELAKLEDMKKVMSSIKSQFSECMKSRRQGKPYDVFAGGMNGTKFEARIIGADGKFIDGLEFIWQDLIEQAAIVSHLPLWYFGLHWTSRETLAKYENTMVIQTIEAHREDFETSCLKRIIDKYLILIKRGHLDYEIEWPPVDLIDAGEQAKARNLNAMAMAKEVEIILTLRLEGFLDNEQSEQQLQEIGVKNCKLSDEWWQKKQQEIEAKRTFNQLIKYSRYDPEWKPRDTETARKMLSKKIESLGLGV